MVSGKTSGQSNKARKTHESSGLLNFQQVELFWQSNSPMADGAITNICDGK
jgi:hypothetical protein